MNPSSKILVIDASVARAAGGENSRHPDSAHARDFLKAVLDICHKIGMTPAIKAEWDKHESHHARSWRRTMVARKKLVYRPVPENAELREAVDALPMLDKDELTQQKHKTAMLKDCHLLEAAHAFDRRVFSADDIVRHHFRYAAAHIPVIRSVLWGNPLKEPQQVRAWLEAGLPEQDGWRLAAPDA